MKKALSFFTICAAYIAAIAPLNAAVRDGGTTSRGGAASQRVSKTTSTARNASDKTTVLRTTTARNATPVRRQTTTPRIASQLTSPRPTQTTISRAATPSVTARAASDAISTTDTRTGAEYEKCKTAYFTCMDQFCQLKNDDYRRCSCSDRVYELAEIRDIMQDAGQELTAFTENLDVVGMTAEQATAMRTPSDGENALTKDTSASKALLQAIMNSIRGKDSSVGGKYSDLNSVKISFDTVNAFGVTDAGQAIAAYNGQTLYSAVYPSCRNAVRADCNDASLQRAITAYLMAIEQDCNTVATAIETTQKQMKSAIRESSAMLDLARVENRQKHNSSDITTCINEVEAAILSEQVCGKNYHKCLDNGEFIDITTGAPIAGVEKFYELGNLLTFTTGVDAANQKLSKITANRPFVQNFENKTKKFARDALDKCVENADIVWEEYLDKAMLSIYYAQKAKVNEIKQGCFDFVSACYTNTEAGMTAAMKELIEGADIILQPDKIQLSTKMCNDYITSCDLMFDNQIVVDYVQNQTNVDTLTACRAVVKQCFDKFGGPNYENFYYPYSGLFKTGAALDWFTLTERDIYDPTGSNNPNPTYVSRCAQQLQEIDSCNSKEMIEKAFGGFDRIVASHGTVHESGAALSKFFLDDKGEYNSSGIAGKHKKYGTLLTDAQKQITLSDGSTVSAYVLEHHVPRPTGVATEIYNQIVDTLSTQCMNIQGRFVELQLIRDGLYKEDNLCLATFENSAYSGDMVPNLIELYSVGKEENMCPREYDLNVDTQSWGACLCWENGARRSKWGKSPKCVAAFPVTATAENAPNDAICSKNDTLVTVNDSFNSQFSVQHWCTAPNALLSSDNKICPLSGSRGPTESPDTKADGTEADPSAAGCKDGNGNVLYNLPDGLGY